MSNIVAVSIGDPNGVGIHILIDCWKGRKIKNFILFTDIEIIKNLLVKKGIYKKINIINKKNKINFEKKKFNIYTYKSHSKEGNTYQSLKFVHNFCKNKFCIGLITLPIRKDLIKLQVDKKFIGHTEFFQKLENKENINMILYHNNIIISPLTTHVEIKKISKIILNKNFLYNQILNLNKCLEIDFKIKKPKIALSGFNPHSGENGTIGIEEKKSIEPSIKKLRLAGINIDGPISADSILLNKNLKKYDCFVFCYHDQALIPFKLISQFSGVNFTGNLEIIRTSPDHGTAYNMINNKNRSNKSFLNCYKLINKIHKNRKLNAQS